MTALIVLAIIVAVIALIMCISLGVDFNYEDEELRLCIKVCGVLLQIYPKETENDTASEKPKKEKKAKKPKKDKEKENGKEKKAQGKKSLPFDMTIDEVVLLVKKVLKALGAFTRRIRTDRIMFHYLGGGSDPCETAVKFANINAAIDAIAPGAKSALNIRDYDIQTDMDFMLEKTKFDFGIAISLTIGSVFRMIFAILNGAIGILIHNRIRILKEKRQNRKEDMLTAKQEKQENQV